MSRSQRTWTQVEVKQAAGAEAWVIVRYRGGAFKLPADAPLSELLEGVAKGWQLSRRSHKGDARVSLPLADYLDLQERAGPKERYQPDEAF